MRLRLGRGVSQLLVGQAAGVAAGGVRGLQDWPSRPPGPACVVACVVRG